MRPRFKDQGFDCTVKGIPVDLRSSIELAESNPFAFEAWAVNQVLDLAPNSKQVADGGIDGRGTLLNKVEGIGTKNVLAQVKSGKVAMDHARAFLTVCEDADVAAVCLFTCERTTYPSKCTRFSRRKDHCSWKVHQRNIPNFNFGR